MTNLKKWLSSLLLVMLAASLAGMLGCGGGRTMQNQPTPQSGAVFVTGTDAPLASVVSFQVDLTGMTVSDGVNPPQPILSGTQTVDFARLNGLRTLLSLNSIPAGTYTTVQITLANPRISYLNVSPPAKPTISMLDATTTPPASLSQSSVTILLNQPLVVNSGDLIGLAFDFDLRHSIQVDVNGQVTGLVVPNIRLKAITPDAPEADIDELIGGVVSVDLTNKSFVMQGPHGRQITVQTNDQTEFEDGEGLDQLTTNSIVEVSGKLQRNSLTLLADEVEILSQDKFFMGGLVTFVDPPTGPATDFDLFVRSVLPAVNGIKPGETIATLHLDGNERFFIYRLRTPLASFVFNSSLMVAGQRVSAGGALSGSGASQTLDVKRVVLHHQGKTGTWVVGSTNTANGTFQFNSNGLAGVLFNGPITVFTSPFTRWRGGLTSLGDLTGSSPIPLRVVGLILKDPVSGNPVFVARIVEKLS